MKRTMQILVALVGMLLISFAVPVVVQAEVTYTPLSRPDITLASPSTVEAPTTIVLSSPYPDVEVGHCGQVGTSVNCYPYLLGRSGPDANGRYLSEWSLPMAPTGAVEFWASTASLYYSTAAVITFTVTGNRFKYDDFRSCVYEEFWRPEGWYERHPSSIRKFQAIVDYYAQVNTSLTYQLQKKTWKKTGWRWVAAKSYNKAFDFPIAESEFSEGYDPFSRRETKQNIQLVYGSKHPAPKYRVVYFVRQGKKLLKQGVVSKMPCQKHPHAPYYTP